MSRSNYSDDIDDQWAHIRWRGQVSSAIGGRRGQAFLRELVEALDAMPDKKLISHELQSDDGVCAIGSVGVKRGMDLKELDPYNYNTIAATFGIAAPLVRELEWINDGEGWTEDSQERRWQSVRDWAVSLIGPPP